jgi:hypothetical protein
VSTLVLGLGADAQADRSVIGQWRFDEGAGQLAVDDGPFALDGRLGTTEGVDADDPGRIPGTAGGGALRFDGRAFVRLPDATQLASPGALTVEATVRGSGSPGDFRYVVSHGAEGCVAGSFGLYTAAEGGMAFYVFDGQSYRVSATARPADVWDGGWHHVAGVFDGRTLQLFVDGRLVGAPLPAPVTIAYSLTSIATYFGTYQGTCQLPLNGDLDLVRLWTGALTAPEIRGLADAALNPSAAGPPPVGPAASTVPRVPATPTPDTSPREGLAPAASGTKIPAKKLPVTVHQRGAPPRACLVRSSVKRLRAGHKVSVTVRVALRGHPLTAVGVQARDGRTAHRLASGKTGTAGSAKLRFRVPRRGTVRLVVTGRRDCGSAVLSVRR